MKFYHRTTEENWKKIQKEGFLWGIPSANSSYRYTYLSSEDFGNSYGSILLEVNYEPKGDHKNDNYGFHPPLGEVCWQFCVFIPISVEKCKKIRKPTS